MVILNLKGKLAFTLKLFSLLNFQLEQCTYVFFKEKRHENLIPWPKYLLFWWNCNDFIFYYCIHTIKMPLLINFCFSHNNKKHKKCTWLVYMCRLFNLPESMKVMYERVAPSLQENASVKCQEYLDNIQLVVFQRQTMIWNCSRENSIVQDMAAML